MAKLSNSDKNLVKKTGKAVADATVAHVGDLIKQTPALGLAYHLFVDLTGNAAEMRKQRVFEFMEAIVDNPNTFTNQLLESETFQDGFATTLQQYITLRTEGRRQLVRAAFEDFARSLDKPNFQLERFIDTTQKISPASISLLGFIKETILPYRDEAIHKDLATRSHGTEKSYDWWFENTKLTEPVSKHLGEWLSDRYGLNGEDVKKQYGVTETKDIPAKEQFRLMGIETAQRNKYSAPVGELTYLGIVSNYYSYDGWGGGGMHWTITDFGYEFMTYIESKERTPKPS
jgi:hypothetical protein